MSNEAYFDMPGNHADNKDYYNENYGGFIHYSAKFLGPCRLGVGVVIEEDVVIGPNCFIGHNAIIRPRSSMGEHSELRAYGWLANDVIVGHHTTIYQYANLSMGTKIGNYCYFGVGSITTNANDIVLHRGREFVPNPPVIEDYVRVATKVLFLPGVVVGCNALIGAGSLVTKNVGSHEIWYGSPASLKGHVEPGDVPIVVDSCPE